MDIGLIRGLLTVTLMALFLGMWFWSWSKKRDAEFEAAARIPLEDDDRPPAIDSKTEQHS
jgi:cytochrome c oxidase cbb3-type subunit IV